MDKAQSHTALDIRHLSVGYSGKVVAQDINATLERGTLTCLIGPNGAGKSTLLRTLCAFQSPIDGHIIIYTDTRAEDLTTLSKMRVAKTIGVVLTDITDTGNITAWEVVALGRSPYTDFRGRLTDADRRIVDDSMAMAGIANLSSRKMRRLSDGERQKVMIAKALAQQTPLMVLDEPTAFLDYPGKVDTLRLLRRMTREHGITVLMSTHDIEPAMQAADNIWYMNGGRDIVTGTPGEMLRSGVLDGFVTPRSPAACR